MDIAIVIENDIHITKLGNLYAILYIEQISILNRWLIFIPPIDRTRAIIS